jgi:hypothetical protein
MRHRSNSTTRLVASAVAIVVLGALSAGCEIIVDFNRALIEGGVDGSFSTPETGSADDAGDGGVLAVDSGSDGGLGVPDAVADVAFSDVSCGTCTKDSSVVDAPVDSGHDATVDATIDGASDAPADSAHDATGDSAHDALGDSARDAATGG